MCAGERKGAGGGSQGTEGPGCSRALVALTSDSKARLDKAQRRTEQDFGSSFSSFLILKLIDAASAPPRGKSGASIESPDAPLAGSVGDAN